MRIFSILKAVIMAFWRTCKAVTGIILVIVLLGSLALNITTLFWNAGSLAVSSAIHAVTGLQTVAQKRASKTKVIKKSVVKRAKRMAAVNLAAAPLEFLPLVGGGVAFAVTVWELDQSCKMMMKLNELDEIFEFEDGTKEDETEVCGMKVPSIGEPFDLGRLLEKYNKLVDEGVEGIPSWNDLFDNSN